MPDSTDSSFGRFGSGQAVRRIEDRALLAGAGRFTDDFAPPGQTHLFFLRSPHAHARIASIDTAPALALPGVVAVITGEELAKAGVRPMAPSLPFKRPDGSPLAAAPRSILATGHVRFVGEAVAAVVAESPAAARDGAEAILVEYEELPAVSGLRQAAAPGAPLVWPAATGNVVAEARYGDAATTEAAFDAAAHVVALDLVNQRLSPVSLEPRVVLAEHDPAADRITVRMSSQMPSGARDSMAKEVLEHPGREGAGAGRRCRRRLRHEDGALSGGCGGRLRRAAGGPSGEMGGDAAG